MTVCDMFILLFNSTLYLQGHLNSTGLTLESSFTPDSRFVISGSQNGRLHIWSADTGEEVTVLDGGHPHPSHAIQFNPKFMMMASACKSIVSYIVNTVPLHNVIISILIMVIVVYCLFYVGILVTCNR